MVNTSKTVNRQAFGPNETDVNLCYFVCWDTEFDPEGGVADRWAHFTHDDDAVGFFKEKSKDADIYVWKGELGRSQLDENYDWFHTDWSKSLETHLTQKRTPGMGYRFYNDAFEAFEALVFEEEEAE